MTVVYTDGSTLTCSEIEVYENDLFCDEYRIVPRCDVERIEDDNGDEIDMWNISVGDRLSD